MPTVHLLDYGAGNVRSVRNALGKLGCDIVDVRTPEDLSKAKMLVFPGVGAFGSAMERLHSMKMTEALVDYVKKGRPFFGVCLGMQLLFESSDESKGVKGLGIIPGNVSKFEPAGHSPIKEEEENNSSSGGVPMRVPHMGWNGLRSTDPMLEGVAGSKEVYFVHSYKAEICEENKDWIMSLTDYGTTSFISSVRKGRVVAMQFHPEKSGKTGLSLIKKVLDVCLSEASIPTSIGTGGSSNKELQKKKTTMCNRIIACLDVRSNDDGDLVVTKGDCYDVREKSDDGKKGRVRNLGKPVALAQRYYEEGADEITFLNITSFREMPATDAPMINVLQETSKNVFVPLTIGGGIRDYKDTDGNMWSALDVASTYFRAGADKVSIGSDAVKAAMKWWADGKKACGKSSIEQISSVYGAQAVVISVDPKRAYVASKDSEELKNKGHTVIETKIPGPNGEKFCWFRCTSAGGRKELDFDVAALVIACEALGAGEILLNSIDCDGQQKGYDLELIDMVCRTVTLPVIASSGAGKPQHFSDLFESTTSQAALASGIFHRKQVQIEDVKKHLKTTKHAVRM
mmetsp:Transcript_16629/g.26571  ORF Transcript_16629/g.26571 Transcript_16629/m.26571 type:complete len:571 (+) Transcript_16629:54-1766(+)